MGIPFILDEHVLAAIHRLSEVAAANPLPLKLLQEYATGVRPIPADFNHDRTISIPIAYEATFTHEEHKPGLICRHLSVSVAKRDRVPNEHSLQMLLDAFGFVNKLVEYDGDEPNDGIVVRESKIVMPPKLIIWEERFSHGVAINILEPLDGDISKMMRAK